MIANLKPYPTYKDSGVPWLGEVPEHWKVLRAQYLFREVDLRTTTGTETHLSMSQRLGLVPSSEMAERRLVSESYIGAKLCEPGDLVLNRLKAHLGVFACTSRGGLVSPDYTVLRRASMSVSMSYFEPLLKSPTCRGELRTRAKGLVEGFWRLYTDDFYTIRLPLPLFVEQTGIARFLDHADRRIRHYIRAKQKLIKLLEEQKQAIIHRAVTRGLDPNVRLNPSGVEWLGDIPEHWEVVPLRRRWTVTDCKHLTVPFVEEGIPLASVREAQSFDLVLDKAQRTTTAWYEKLIEGGRTPRRGDLIYCRNVSVGAAAFVNTQQQFAMGQDVCLIQSGGQNQRYLNYFLHSLVMDRQLALLLVGSTFDRINVADIKKLIIVVPPRDEQDAIAEYLDASLRDIGRCVEGALREIRLLREYRTRLIADVVTGKLDVRAAAAKLPDETDEPEPVDDEDTLAEGEEETDDADLGAVSEEPEV
jgi:type I restriction enzyme S subunit